MPDDWYYRDKPLSNNTVKPDPGEIGWTDAGRFWFPIENCLLRGLNCTATCCKQTYCAPEMADCIEFVRRDYNELSLAILLILVNVIGVPTCIRATEFCLMKKFGSWLDEDENVQVGGTTLCECCTYCLTCKKNPNGRNNKSSDAALEEVDHDGEFAEEELKGKAQGRRMVEEKKPGCCSVCCRAVFCCGKGNTVSREFELADLLAVAADRNAEESSALLASPSGDKGDGMTIIDPAGSEADALPVNGKDGDKEVDIVEEEQTEEEESSMVSSEEDDA